MSTVETWSLALLWITIMITRRWWWCVMCCRLAALRRRCCRGRLTRRLWVAVWWIRRTMWSDISASVTSATSSPWMRQHWVTRMTSELKLTDSVCRYLFVWYCQITQQGWWLLLDELTIYSNPLEKIWYIWNCSKFFRQIDIAYRGGFRPHVLQISLQ